VEGFTVSDDMVNMSAVIVSGDTARGYVITEIDSQENSLTLNDTHA